MGLLDSWGKWTGDPQKDNAIGQGLLATAFRLMDSRGNLGQAIGQAGLTGLGAYNATLVANENNDLRALQGEQMRAQMEDRKRAQAEAERQAQVRARFMESLQPTTGANVNERTGLVGPTPAAAVQIGQQPQIDPYAAIQALGPEMAKTLFEAKNWGRPEVARTVEGADGIEQRDKFGNLIGPAIPRYIAPQMLDLGDKKTFVVPQAGASYAVGMSPDQRDASARGWAGVSNARERLAFDKTEAGKPKDGSEKPMTDAQSKAALFGSRMEASNNVIEKLEGNGTTTSIPGARTGFGIGAVLNTVSSSEQQQLNQAKRDFVNAVLRRESGAVISDAEFANAEQQYFPQIGDSKEVIAQKAANRRLAIRGVQAEVPKAQRGVLSEIQDTSGATINFGDLK